MNEVKTAAPAVAKPEVKEDKAKVVEPELSPIEKDRRAVVALQMSEDHFEDKWKQKP